MTLTTRPLYREIASLLAAIRNCEKSGNDEWFDKHHARLLHRAGAIQSHEYLSLCPTQPNPSISDPLPRFLDGSFLVSGTSLQEMSDAACSP